MTAPLWTWQEFAAAAGGRLAGAPPDVVTGLSIDTRTIEAGQAFFAIKGDRFDGHDFVDAALAGGAAVAVVAENMAISAGQGALLAVDDPLAAMTRLAVAARQRSRARIVAVTGSVGKTGTKEALRLALAATGATHASPASFNNHWGVPYALACLPADAAFAVFEIGMNHAGEITPLAGLVRPHVALITNVAPVHIGYFNSVDEIAQAKAEILTGLEPGGIAILPRDNDYFSQLSESAAGTGAKVVSFGESHQADIHLLDTDAGPASTRVRAMVHGRPITYQLGAPGMHVVRNSLGVLAVVEHLGADLAAGAGALGAMRAPKGRGERTLLKVGAGTAVLIDESYNANPESMGAALAMLAATAPGPGGRRIAVLGDMLELGDHGQASHAALRDAVVAAKTDRVFACGPLMGHLWRQLPDSVKAVHETVAGDLLVPLAGQIRSGDVIMVKGSLGSAMGPLVAGLQVRFSDTAENL